VYLNGVLLKLTDDYTAANGSDIVLTSGAATGDVLEFITFADFTVNNQNFTGGLTVDNDGSTVLTVDRATSDGTIIDLQKSGSSVGVVGVHTSNEIYISNSSNIGLRTEQTGPDRIEPCFSTGAGRDNGIDLGSTDYRFKDLYLSGGVYLGGTGSANKLDDYEEGTWTPIYTASTTNPTITYSSSEQSASYIKIGKMVFIQGTLRVTSVSGGSGSLRLSGLPFTAQSAASPERPGGISTSGYQTGFGTNHPTGGYINVGTDYFALMDEGDGVNAINLLTSDLTNTCFFMFHGQYKTD
jgi:hypothetical protein